MTVFLSLVAAAIAGTSDFIGGLAARKAPALLITFLGQLTGLVVGLVMAFVVPGEFIAADLGWGLLGGVGSALGLLSLYAGYANARVSIAAPVAGVGAAAMPVIVDVLTGSDLSARAAVGITLGLVAIALISSGRSTVDASVGVSLLYGLGGAVGLGSLLTCLAQTSPDGGVWSVPPTRLSGAAVMAVVMLVRGVSFGLPRVTLPHVVAVGLMGTTANALFVVAADLGSVSTASVLLAMFPAATVLWARFVFKERLMGVQLAGIGLALAAVALIVSS